MAFFGVHLRRYALRPGCGSNKVAPINVIWYGDGVPPQAEAALIAGDYLTDAPPIDIPTDDPPPVQRDRPISNPINDHFGTHYDPDVDNGCRVKNLTSSYFGSYTGWVTFLTTRLGNTPQYPYTTPQYDIDPNTYAWGRYSISAARRAFIETTCYQQVCGLPQCYWLPWGSLNGYRYGRLDVKAAMDVNLPVSDINHDAGATIDLGRDCSLDQEPITPDGIVTYVRVPS